jgi:inositol polyphosphate 1-phosphatase
MGTRFLESLLKVSEKAANIARVIRQDEHLIKLLVQEKKGSEKNPRFVQDFKTLADVLIQETVKHDIGNQVSVLIRTFVNYSFSHLSFSLNASMNM